MVIIAITARTEHWNEIAVYCKSKEDILRSIFSLKLENGIPTKDTFQRIFAIIKPKKFGKCFMNRIKSVINIPKNEWANLNTVGMVRSKRIINGIGTVENRYFISSVTDIHLFLKAVR